MKIADMHCDTISKLYENHRLGNTESILKNHLHLDLEKMTQGDYGIQNFALYTDLNAEKKPLEYALMLLDTFYMEMEQHSDLIGVVKSYSDIMQNWNDGRMSAMLTIEEGAVCQGQISNLRNFYRLGVRMMTLTWNFPNELAYPNRYTKDDHGQVHWEAEEENGLTEKGIEFLHEMERLGMIVDISHLSDAGIREVFRHTTRPFVASHSNARSITCHPRNLTDDMIRQLSERGGVTGINYCAGFLRNWKDGEERISTLSDIVSHMKHIRQVGGIGCIGLGSDFDGISSTLEMASAAQLPMLEHEMKKQGFTESEIEAIFYKNVLSLYREILK